MRVTCFVCLRWRNGQCAMLRRGSSVAFGARGATGVGSGDLRTKMLRKQEMWPYSSGTGDALRRFVRAVRHCSPQTLVVSQSRGSHLKK